MKLLIVIISVFVLVALGAATTFHADEIKGQIQVIKGTSNTISQIDISDDSGIGLTQDDVQFNGAGEMRRLMPF